MGQKTRGALTAASLRGFEAFGTFEGGVVRSGVNRPSKAVQDVPGSDASNIVADCIPCISTRQSGDESEDGVCVSGCTGLLWDIFSVAPDMVY